MKRTLATLLAAVAVIVFTLPTVVAQKVDQADVQLKAAIKKEVVDGDLKAAIELYRRIAQGSDRAVAARALLRMGQCYAKLGDAESTKAFQRVVSEFADQKEVAEEARALLAASSRDRRPATGVSEQQVWVIDDSPRSIPLGPSADGRYIPFVDFASTRLSVRDLTTSESRVVIKSEPGYSVDSPSISPDSRQVAYTRYTHTPVGGDRTYELRVAGLDGSRARVLVSQKGRFIWPVGWSPDGRLILATVQNSPSGSSVALVSAVEGSVRVLTTGDDYGNGCFSPDGKYIITYKSGGRTASPAAFGLTEGAATHPPGGLMLRPVDGGKAVALFESAARNWAPFWAPDGRHIVFLSDRSGTTALWAIRMNGTRPEGEPELVRRDIGQPMGFTRDGSFYCRTTTGTQWNVYAVDVDPATGRALSKPERVNERHVGTAGLPAEWSPDGQLLAYTDSTQDARGVIDTTVHLIFREDRTGTEREVVLTPPLEPGFSAVELQWFPDGRSVLAQISDQNNRRSYFCRINVQTGQMTTLLDLRSSDESVSYPALSQDGKTLFYVHMHAGQDSQTDRLMRRNLETGEVKELSQAGWIENLVVSRDGRELLFEGRYQDQKTISLLIMPAEGGAPRELYRSKDYLEDHAWTRDGQRVWMVPAVPCRAELWSITAAGGEAQPSGLTESGMFSLSVRPDGRRIAFTTSACPSDEVWLVRNLLSAPKASR